MTSRELSLNTAACRLLQNIAPGLETSAVFQEKVKRHRWTVSCSGLSVCVFRL